jgi:hypothetical protein
MEKFKKGVQIFDSTPLSDFRQELTRRLLLQRETWNVHHGHGSIALDSQRTRDSSPVESYWNSRRKHSLSATYLSPTNENREPVTESSDANSCESSNSQMRRRSTVLSLGVVPQGKLLENMIPEAPVETSIPTQYRLSASPKRTVFKPPSIVILPEPEEIPFEVRNLSPNRSLITREIESDSLFWSDRPQSIIPVQNRPKKDETDLVIAHTYVHVPVIEDTKKPRRPPPVDYPVRGRERRSQASSARSRTSSSFYSTDVSEWAKTARLELDTIINS